jgi:hypothetical protein
VKVNVYVDGFNLYFGAVAGTRWKWLDLAALSAQLAPEHTIHRIRYFTAPVISPPNDRNMRNRQKAYIAALETLPDLSVHYGHFQRTPTRMPLKYPPPAGLPGVKVHRDGNHSVLVIKTEEKGSDVNLATYLVADGFRDDYEGALILSNDGDLKEAVRIVQSELDLHTIVVNPHRGKPLTRPLAQVCAEQRDLRKAALKGSQFPDSVKVPGGGAVSRPSTW